MPLRLEPKAQFEGRLESAIHHHYYQNFPVTHHYLATSPLTRLTEQMECHRLLLHLLPRKCYGHPKESNIQRLEFGEKQLNQHASQDAWNHDQV